MCAQAWVIVWRLGEIRSWLEGRPGAYSGSLEAEEPLSHEVIPYGVPPRVLSYKRRRICLHMMHWPLSFRACLFRSFFFKNDFDVACLVLGFRGFRSALDLSGAIISIIYFLVVRPLVGFGERDRRDGDEATPREGYRTPFAPLWPLARCSAGRDRGRWLGNGRLEADDWARA